MKINGNEIRPGNTIRHKGELWIAVKTHAVKPGKGGAFAQVELKNIQNGTKLNERFRAAETVEKIRLEQKKYQFLYQNADTLAIMDTQTYEQTEISAEMLGETLIFLQENMILDIEFYEEKPISANIPENVTLEVTQTEPTIKGQTAAASYKPAIMENNARVMVPPFIETGDRIIINTQDATYVKRAE